AHLALLDHEHSASVDENDRPRDVRPAFQRRREEPRGPDLAEPADERAAARRRGAHERERLENGLDVREILAKRRKHLFRGRLVEQVAHGGFIARRELAQRVLDRLTGDGTIDQAEQLIGHAFHRGDDDGERSVSASSDDARYPLEAARISDARASEFMDDPGHRKNLYCKNYGRNGRLDLAPRG